MWVVYLKKNTQRTSPFCIDHVMGITHSCHTTYMEYTVTSHSYCWRIVQGLVLSVANHKIQGCVIQIKLIKNHDFIFKIHGFNWFYDFNHNSMKKINIPATYQLLLFFIIIPMYKQHKFTIYTVWTCHLHCRIGHIYHLVAHIPHKEHLTMHVTWGRWDWLRPSHNLILIL